jgi:CheY-like chemotaxis protein
MPDKILIVEDNLQNMKVMAMSLRPHGYNLIQAVDGEEAFETAVREKPDLVIMDMRLPKMDGIEVTKKLRNLPEFNSIPIIAVTAYAMKGDKERFLGAGCDFYLSKPIDTRQLPQVVAEILQKHRQGQ